MQKIKTFIGLVAVAGILLGTTVYAQEPVITTSFDPVLVSPFQSTLDELQTLKAEEASPETNSITRFFIRLKIRQLENQLNIKKALS